MSRLLARYWLLVPLLLGTLLVRDWVEGPASLAPEEPLEIQRLRADYYLEEFTTRRFDESGALEYLLSGDALSHYPEDDRAEISRPRVELHRREARWYGRADAGTLVRDPRDVVTLVGDVRLERAARAAPEGGDDADGTRGAAPAARERARALDPSSLPARIEIRADDLSVAVESNELFTDGPVEVIAPGWRLSAVGLRSDLEAGKLDLRSDVNGRYEVVSP